jgi:hypothetical protein
VNECVSRLSRCLEKLTDDLLKKKDPPTKPIVGEPPLIDLIVNVRKSNFVIEAHTGGGKTTLGLTLYHKARLGEILGYDIIFVNLREAVEALKLRKEDFEKRILSMIFDHESDEYRSAEKHIYATVKLKIKCASFYECIEEFQRFSEEHRRRLIVLFDEFERAYNDWGIVERTLTNWFSDTRRFYDKTGNVPIKLVTLLPKVLRVDEFEVNLRSTNEAVAVFTEFRELRITDEVLRSYIWNLGNHVNPIFKSLLGYNGFKRLLSILGKLQSGRYVFPRLWEAIARSVCEAVNGQIEGDEEMFLRRLKDIRLPDIDVDLVVDPLVVGIAEGKPFRTQYTRSRSTVIEIWENGFSSLCEKVRNSLLGGVRSGEAIRPLRIGYLNFICKSDETFIWLTLEKSVDIKTLKTVGITILEAMGGIPASLSIIALIPEFARGVPERSLTIPVTRESLGVEREREGGRRRATEQARREITVEYKYRTLKAEELLSIASKGGLVGFDIVIADKVIEELAHDIVSLIGKRQ